MADQMFAGRIKAFLLRSGIGVPFLPVPEETVRKAEERLGFAIPEPLRTCYGEVGNGGYGPGYGIIGLEGGYSSDHGTLLEIYDLFRQGDQSDAKEWPRGLLPFCEWGCNIYTCVCCLSATPFLFRCDEGDVEPHNFTLDEFFELWMTGIDPLSYGAKGGRGNTKTIINPFTGEKGEVRGR